nr:condensation domain-containing protein [uncultured bacterium]
MRRHEVLRTRFVSIDEQPMQIIASETDLNLAVIDLRGMPQAESKAEAQRLIAQETCQPFNLSSGPLLRVSLLRLEENEQIVVVTMHHIISDGWSMGVFVREVVTLYEAYAAGEVSPLPELTIQYADYAVWQREWLQGEVLEQQLDYWRRQLEGAPAVLELPTDHPRPAIQSFQGAQQSLSFAASLSHSLKALSQREGVTLFMTLLAAFQTLLSRYSGQDEIVIGTPIAGRTRAEIEPLIGFFVNTLVLRSSLKADFSFRHLLRQVRELTLAAYAHQDLPFEKLVEELRLERSLSHQPLFQVMFVLQNAPRGATPVGGLKLKPEEVKTGSAAYDLTLSMLEAGEVLGASLEYNTDLFEQQSIERMVGHFQRLLEGIVADPEQRVSELPLLSEAELHQLLYQWNDTRAPFPAESCIHQLFEAQVARTPDAVAVIYEEEQLTYRELNARANQLAHHLRSLGVGAESLVGILLERSPEMVISLLAVLKAGAAYVPLDPQYPHQRLQWMVEDAHLSVLLTTEGLRQAVAADAPGVIYLDRDWERIARHSDERVEAGVGPLNLAYVIYTSGSTGRPKGVCIEHRSLVNYTCAVAPHFRLQPADRILQFAPLGFDVLVEELFPCLTSGGCLVLRQDQPLAVAEFTRLIARQRITGLEVPAAFWHQWVAELVETGEKLPDSLRLVIVGAEKPRIERVREWQERTGKDLIYIFGLTETTVTNTLYHLGAGEEVGQWRRELPIGSPVANTQVYVLDGELRPVGVGINGELYIGGDGLGRGYLGWAEWTAERCIPDPYSGEAGARLSGRGRGCGGVGRELEFIGRADGQVKGAWLRIEAGRGRGGLEGGRQSQRRSWWR